MAGVPGISVPAGLTPTVCRSGLQVIGKPFDEATVFAVGAALERAAGFDALPQIQRGSLSDGLRDRRIAPAPGRSSSASRSMPR